MPEYKFNYLTVNKYMQYIHTYIQGVLDIRGNIFFFFHFNFFNQWRPDASDAINDKTKVQPSSPYAQRFQYKYTQFELA